MRNVRLAVKRSPVETEQITAVFVGDPVEPELQPASFPPPGSSGDMRPRVTNTHLIYVSRTDCNLSVFRAEAAFMLTLTFQS